MKKYKEFFFDCLRIIEVFGIVSGVIFAGFQLLYLRNANYGLTSLEVTKELYTTKTYPANPKIISDIHLGNKIVEGKTTDEDLNNFLGLMEWIENAEKVGVLNDEIIYQMFSVDIIDAYNNKEIRDFIYQARSDYKDDSFFSGFEDLAKRMIARTNRELKK